MLEKIKYRIIKKLVPKIYILNEFDVDLNMVELKDDCEISPNDVKNVKMVDTYVCLTKGRCFDIIINYLTDLKNREIQYEMFINDDDQDHIRLVVRSDEGDKLFYIDTSEYAKLY